MDGLNIEIRPMYDHFSIYIDGAFYCSADDQKEAAEEVDKYIAKHSKRRENDHELES